MKLPFGGAQGAVFDFLCPLWFGRLTNQAQCNVAEVKEKDDVSSALRLRSVTGMIKVVVTLQLGR